MPKHAAEVRQGNALIALFVAAWCWWSSCPFFFVRQAQALAAEAGDWVNHTARVEASVQALLYDLRNRESATLAYALGHDTPAIRERLAESQRDIPVDLDNVRTLTRDNPNQQVRVGRLAALVDQRSQISADILAKPPGQANETEVGWLLDRSPIRQVGNEIANVEHKLMLARTARSAVLDQRSRVISWLAAIVQVALLLGLALLLRRLLAGRRSAEAAAQRSSARAQAVLETVREPVVVLDRNFSVVMHNPAFAEVFSMEGNVVGSQLDAIGGATWASQETRQRLGDVLARDRELWDHEIQFVDSLGRDRSLLVNARRMVLPDTSDEVALVTANDVTAQKVAERQVRELNRQLQGKVEQVSEVNRELEAFSYSVSHDLRAPLRHIGGFADKLGRHLGDRNDEKSLHYINVITTSARRMSRLIDDLLVYSRLGRSALRLLPVDLQSLVEEIRAMLDANNAQDQPGHQIEWRIAPLPIVVGDENMLRQVWLNLLSNAVKYSARTEPAVIRVDWRRLDDGQYEFDVVDNGVGFDMTYAGKLFGVFQRLHSVSEFEGTGIGLASVRRVLSRHGGQIQAQSTPGEGARFTFTLPAPGDATPTEKTP